MAPRDGPYRGIQNAGAGQTIGKIGRPLWVRPDNKRQGLKQMVGPEKSNAGYQFQPGQKNIKLVFRIINTLSFFNQVFLIECNPERHMAQDSRHKAHGDIF